MGNSQKSNIKTSSSPVKFFYNEDVKNKGELQYENKKFISNMEIWQNLVVFIFNLRWFTAKFRLID